MPKKKAEKHYSKATLASVKKELAKPRCQIHAEKECEPHLASCWTEEPASVYLSKGGQEEAAVGRKRLCELLLLRGSPRGMTSAVGCTEFSLGTISWWEATLPILIGKYAAFR
jgi:hypothetical protein